MLSEIGEAVFPIHTREDKKMDKAIEIIDGLQRKYYAKLAEATSNGDKAMIAHWQAYLSALTMAATELEKNK